MWETLSNINRNIDNQNPKNFLSNAPSSKKENFLIPTRNIINDLCDKKDKRKNHDNQQQQLEGEQKN